jgi:hypothetical protein
MEYFIRTSDQEKNQFYEIINKNNLNQLILMPLLFNNKQSYYNSIQHIKFLFYSILIEKYRGQLYFFNPTHQILTLSAKKSFGSAISMRKSRN